MQGCACICTDVPVSSCNDIRFFLVNKAKDMPYFVPRISVYMIGAKASVSDAAVSCVWICIFKNVKVNKEYSHT
jgi:hypothetical protein